MILAIFDIQVTPVLPFKFQVNWPFGSGEEVKNIFSRWRPSCISELNSIIEKEQQKQKKIEEQEIGGLQKLATNLLKEKEQQKKKK